MRIRSTLYMLLPALALACGGDDPASVAYAPFDGEWRGSLNGINVRVFVTDNDGNVSGTGILTANGTLNINVSGEHDHPDVLFHGTAAGYSSFRYDGRFEHRDTIWGTANGSGFTEDRLRLVRQP